MTVWGQRRGSGLRRRAAGGGLLAGLGLAVAPTGLSAQQAGPMVVITEYELPTPESAPGGITVGPDGALWFHMSVGNKLGRITTDGRLTEYPIPVPNASQRFQGFLGVGPDRAIWFTMNARDVNRIGRLTLDGRFADFPIPTPNGGPFAATAGPDGAVWFTETDANQIGRITVDGAITEFPLPTPDSRPLGIVLGPDGALWFTEVGGNKLARITTAGAVTEFPVPTPNSFLLRNAVGPDRAIWFVGYDANTVGRVTVDGGVTEFRLPSAVPVPRPTGEILTAGPIGITAGPDGALWFTEGPANRIGRITTDGRITEYPVPSPNSSPYHIVSGPDGALWFTQIMGNRIGRAQLRPAAPAGLPRTGAPGVGLPLLAGAGAALLAALPLRRREGATRQPPPRLRLASAPRGSPTSGAVS
jgi:virginiamycin B lyase